MSLAPAQAFAGSYLRVESWNLRHEGWSGETDYLGDAEQIWFEFGSSANSPAGCDVVFLQEVMNLTVASLIARELTGISGKPWVAVTSPLVGRTSYKEAYAVLYRPDRVVVDWVSMYVDVGDQFEREPQIVKLRDKRTDADFTFINWHAVYGTTAKRRAEVAQIARVFQEVQDADPFDQDVILLGDHNAPGTSSWWQPMGAITPPVGTPFNFPTTLNSSGSYTSPYDHFWMQRAYVREYANSGRDYVQDAQFFVAGLSDHAPIWLKLYSSSDTD